MNRSELVNAYFDSNAIYYDKDSEIDREMYFSNDDEEKEVVAHCAYCNNNILDGDTYYQMSRGKMCWHCIREAREVSRYFEVCECGCEDREINKGDLRYLIEGKWWCQACLNEERNEAKK